jgi:hypothetical protein
MARTFTLERKQGRQGAACYNAYCTAEAVRSSGGGRGASTGYGLSMFKRFVLIIVAILLLAHVLNCQILPQLLVRTESSTDLFAPYVTTPPHRHGIIGRSIALSPRVTKHKRPSVASSCTHFLSAALLGWEVKPRTGRIYHETSW